MVFRKTDLQTNEQYIQEGGSGETQTMVSSLLEVSNFDMYNSSNLSNFLLKSMTPFYALSGAVFNTKRKSCSEQRLPALYCSSLAKHLLGDLWWACRGCRCHQTPLPTVRHGQRSWVFTLSFGNVNAGFL